MFSFVIKKATNKLSKNLENFAAKIIEKAQKLGVARTMLSFKINLLFLYTISYFSSQMKCQLNKITKKFQNFGNFEGEIIEKPQKLREPNIMVTFGHQVIFHIHEKMFFFVTKRTTNRNCQKFFLILPQK